MVLKQFKLDILILLLDETKEIITVFFTASATTTGTTKRSTKTARQNKNENQTKKQKLACILLFKNRFRSNSD